MGNISWNAKTEDKPCIKCVDDLLSLNLKIPNYQRPYKWGTTNINDLLSDIQRAITKSKDHNKNEFKYRVGSIILYKKEDSKEEVYEVIDGQQRIISLTLLKYFLDEKFNSLILNQIFPNTITQQNIKQNYAYIKDWFSLRREGEEGEYKDALENILEVVVIVVHNEMEAFQLFDSQNSRGKALDPHDLLKAYHLREMNNRYEMKRAVAKWESKSPSEIRELFNSYLFSIWNWSRGVKTKAFRVKDIDVYKGVRETEQYTYAKRTSKAMPIFQLTEPFVSGKYFFEMVDYYLNLKKDIEEEIHNNYTEIYNVVYGEDGDNSSNGERKIDRSSMGYKYVINLFYCALMCYYDRFGDLDEVVVRKIFAWSFMLRCDMNSLGFDSVNKYAIGGEGNDRYSNAIPLFLKIKLARSSKEVSSLLIQSSNRSSKWDNLNKCIKTIMGMEESGE